MTVGLSSRGMTTRERSSRSLRSVLRMRAMTRAISAATASLTRKRKCEEGDGILRGNSCRTGLHNGGRQHRDFQGDMQSRTLFQRPASHASWPLLERRLDELSAEIDQLSAEARRGIAKLAEPRFRFGANARSPPYPRQAITAWSRSAHGMAPPHHRRAPPRQESRERARRASASRRTATRKPARPPRAPLVGASHAVRRLLTSLLFSSTD